MPGQYYSLSEMLPLTYVDSLCIKLLQRKMNTGTLYQQLKDP